MAKIESFRDLPEWFDLEKYKGCEVFKAADWYEALFCRCTILRHLPFIDHPEWVESTLQTSIARTRANPLSLPDLEASRRQYIRLPVQSLTFGELLDQCFGERFIKSSNVARWDLFSSGGQRDVLPDEIEKSPILIQGSSTVTVDLGATDSVILASFSRWLKEARASKPGLKSSRNKPAYASWARYGLLPYIDLKLWAKELGNQIPDRVMSRAISSNEHYEMGEENIRKTLAPLAEDLMQDLSALHALAAIEATEET